MPRAATTTPRTRARQPRRPPRPSKDNERKTAEFAEAAQVISGPAGNPECVWLGRRVVRLMWADDLDTAFRHLDLYDRFGCPGGHIQAAFRCLTRFGAQIDHKVPRSLDTRVHACWINPGAQPQTTAAAAAAPGADSVRRRARAGRSPAPRPRRHLRQNNATVSEAVRNVRFVHGAARLAPLKRHGVIPVVKWRGRIILSLPPVGRT